MNIQKPEKRTRDDTGATLDVHSVFGPTIQGEGPFAGKPSFFIRLAGCNLQCPGCDTEYTTGRHTMPFMELVTSVRRMRENHPAVRLVVITGGEPFRQNIAALVTALSLHGFTVQIETNGTLEPRPPEGGTFPYSLCTIVCSPKTGRVVDGVMAHAAAFKYVLRAGDVDAEDGLPTRALLHPAAPRVARPPRGFAGPVYVQPMDEGDPIDNLKHQHAAIKSCFDHGWTYCAQLHKYLNLD